MENTFFKRQAIRGLIYFAFCNDTDKHIDFFSDREDDFVTFKYNPEWDYHFYILGQNPEEWEPYKLISFQTQKECEDYFNQVIEDAAETEFKAILKGDRDDRHWHDDEFNYLVKSYKDFEAFLKVMDNLQTVTDEQRTEARAKREAFKFEILNRYVCCMNYDMQHKAAFNDMTGQDLDLFYERHHSSSDDFDHIECPIQKAEARAEQAMARRLGY